MVDVEKGKAEQVMQPEHQPGDVDVDVGVKSADHVGVDGDGDGESEAEQVKQPEH